MARSGVIVEEGPVSARVGYSADGEADLIEIVDTHPDIDFGESMAQKILFALNVTSGDNDSSGGMFSLDLNGFADLRQGFLTRGLDESAGVDDDDVGILYTAREFVAGSIQAAEHDLAVDQIFCAA